MNHACTKMQLGRHRSIPGKWQRREPDWPPGGSCCGRRQSTRALLPAVDGVEELVLLDRRPPITQLLRYHVSSLVRPRRWWL